MPPERLYEPALAFTLEHPWAITKDMGRIIANLLARRLAGDYASDAEIGAAVAQRRPQVEGRPQGGVGVIPVYGVIVPRANLMSDMSGGTSFDRLQDQLSEMLHDDAVGTIVLDIDSPGGSVAGASEFARAVLKARTKKPVIAQAQYCMASAAYWFGACATEIVAAPSAAVGSIGVYTMHEDLTAALAEKGIKRTYISAGKYKVDGNETEPLTEDVRAVMHERVLSHYTRFVTDVAAGRGLAVDVVQAGFGEGRTVSAEEGVRLGMVDRIGTLDDTIARALQSAPMTALPARALDTAQEPARATAQDRVLSDFHTRLALLSL
jgi:signal peptide peptidase SppA